MGVSSISPSFIQTTPDSFSRTGKVKQGTHRPPTVIVADDDVDNLVLIGYVLEAFPCLLFCETDGKAALELSLKLKPDLLLLDIRLPNLSGLDIVRKVRSYKAIADVPAIAITALASDRDKQRILASGFNQYLSKPYVLEDISQLISLYLKRS